LRVAEKAHPLAVGRDVDGLVDIGAAEIKPIEAGLTLDRVATVARVPDEHVIARAQQRRVVAGAAADDIVAVVAQEGVIALAADERIVARTPRDSPIGQRWPVTRQRGSSGVDH
jgi:hypothetical protein